jgi:hypothetical protein
LPELQAVGTAQLTAEKTSLGRLATEQPATSRCPARRWRNGPSRGLRSICLNAVRWCWNTNCGGTRWSMCAGRTWSWLRFRPPRPGAATRATNSIPAGSRPGSDANANGRLCAWHGTAFVDCATVLWTLDPECQLGFRATPSRRTHPAVARLRHLVSRRGRHWQELHVAGSVRRSATSRVYGHSRRPAAPTGHGLGKATASKVRKLSAGFSLAARCRAVACCWSMKPDKSAVGRCTSS